MVASRHEAFPSFGNRACLDFTATLRNRLQIPVDLLGGFPDLLEWLQSRKLVDDRTARQAVALCARTSGQCQEVFHRALHLRDALYRIFTAIASGRPPA